MGTTQSTTLNDDTNAVPTSGEFGDRGDGTSKWLQWFRVGDGGDAALGATTSAESTSGNGSLIAIAKRLRTLLGDLGTAATNVSTTALATSLVVKASAGRLRGVQGYSTVAQFVQIHDAASLPADGAVPKVVFPIEANKPFSIDFGLVGRSFATGVVVCVSTTGPTKTIGSANTWIDAQVV